MAVHRVRRGHGRRSRGPGPARAGGRRDRRDRHAARHRPVAGGRAVADQGGWRRVRRALAGRPAGLPGLGGLRGSAGRTGRLPARARGAHAAVPAHRAAVRALRRRVPAPAARLPAGPARRPADHARLHDRRGPAGGQVRRVAVRRARRRPAPQRTAPGHVLTRHPRPVRPGQGGLRSARHAEPGNSHRPAPAGRRPARPRRRARTRARGIPRTWPWPTVTTTATSARPCTGAPGSASAART